MSSQRSEKNLHQKALRDASKLSVSMAITMVLALVMKMYMPRALGAERLGVFFFAESFPLLFFSFLPLGIGSYLQKHIPARPEHAVDVFLPTLLFELFLSLILTVAMWITLIVMGYDGETLILCLIMAAYTALLMLYQSILKVLFLALGEVNRIARLDINIKIFLVVGVVGTLFLKGHLYLVAAFHLLSQLFGVGYLLWYGIKKDLCVRKPRFGVLKDVALVSMPFFLTGVFAYLYQSTNASFLSKMSNDAEVGYFGAAMRLQGIFLLMIPILQSAFMPTMSRTLHESVETYKKFCIDILQAILVLSLPLTCGLIFFGREAIMILYGAEFLPAVHIVATLAPVLTLTYLNVFLAMSSTLSSNGVAMAAVMGTTVLLNATMNYFLIPWGAATWGVGGAGVVVAGSTLVAELANAVGLFMVSRVSLWNARVARILFAITLPALGALWAFDELQALPLTTRVLSFVIFVPAYCWITGLVTPREIRLIKSLVPLERLAFARKRS